jgi:N-acetylglucosaminyl-diphospho-decaprenol L-rhamnosyltransferase
MPTMRLISISVVSHLQGSFVARLLTDFEYYCKGVTLEVILTINSPEELSFTEHQYSFPLKIIHNLVPLGFGANHNNAFQLSDGRYFCVINPDIRLNMDPFPALLACLNDSSISVAAPLAMGESGAAEDNARYFPTPLTILCKALGGCKGSDYNLKGEMVYPDWVGGMFMLFRSEIFEKVGGFDQRYFLYYEDVDLCARLRLLGYEIALCSAAQVIHHAHRSSHRNFKYLAWHLSSMLRFFCSLPFLKICWDRLIKRSTKRLKT